MFEVIEICGMQRYPIKNYSSFDEAKAYVRSLGVIELSDDVDYPNCADAFLEDGRLIAIQPEGFKL